MLCSRWPELRLKNQTKVTRAMGDNESASTDALAATTEEKSVSSLLAVAYEKQSSGEMGLYNVFDVNVTPDGCSFDIAKEGAFRPVSGGQCQYGVAECYQVVERYLSGFGTRRADRLAGSGYAESFPDDDAGRR